MAPNITYIPYKRMRMRLSHFKLIITPTTIETNMISSIIVPKFVPVYYRATTD